MAMIIVREEALLLVDGGAAGRGGTGSGGGKTLNMSRMNGCAAGTPEEYDGGEAGDTDVADAQGHSNKHDHKTTAAAAAAGFYLYDDDLTRP